jgi:Zn-finger nucleic acid-binding protein
MDCPACHSAMVTLELADVEIDHCLDCGGIWLDSGELELLMGDHAKALGALGILAQNDSPAERIRRCPLCDKRMKKVAVGSSQPPVVIDRCPRGQGLWFDRDELRQVLAGAGLAADSGVLCLLKDMFGLSGR